MSTTTSSTATSRLSFPQPGIDYPEPLDLWTIRETMPREQWPHTRTYTVRWVDEAAGGTGHRLRDPRRRRPRRALGGRRAARRRPHLHRPRAAATTPHPAADWYLFAGDESALPAIGAVLEALPPDARGLAFLEVDSEADIQAIAAPDGVELRWLLRGGAPAGASEVLLTAVRDAEWPEGRVQVFAHGERGYMKGLRDVFFAQRGLERGQVSLSGYWARAAWRTISRRRRNSP